MIYLYVFLYLLFTLLLDFYIYMYVQNFIYIYVQNLYIQNLQYIKNEYIKKRADMWKIFSSSFTFLEKTFHDVIICINCHKIGNHHDIYIIF